MVALLAVVLLPLAVAVFMAALVLVAVPLQVVDFPRVSNQPESQPLTSGGHGVRLCAYQTCQHVSELFAETCVLDNPMILSVVSRYSESNGGLHAKEQILVDGKKLQHTANSQRAGYLDHNSI